MSYKRRYMKERYVTRKLRRDVYNRLEALCGGARAQRVPRRHTEQGREV